VKGKSPELRGPVLAGDRVNHAWLRTHLGWPVTGRHPIVVRSLSQSDGAMGSVHQVSCGGRSFVFKGPPSDSGTEWGRLVARSGLVEREVQVYRFLQGRRRDAPKISPECYWSVLEPDGRGALALEDLGPPAAPATVMASGLNRAQAFAAVRCLAIAHSTLIAIGAGALAPPWPWLYTASSETLVAAVRMGLHDLPRVVDECWPQGLPGVEPHRFRDVDLEALLQRGHVGAHCVSLCHGDTWASNVLFRTGGEPPAHQMAFLIDWQYAMWGNPLTDVALLLFSSMAPESRADWEDELLRHYHATLTARCAIEYPLHACRDDFRRAQPFSILVALATLEGYTIGMGRQDLSRFASRVTAAVNRFTDLIAGGPASMSDSE
jgi:hypothetical protein